MDESLNDGVPKPVVRCEQYHAILGVSDLGAAIDFYTTKLGFRLAFREGDRFAGVNLGSVQLFLEHGTPSPEGCGVYFVVDDADALYRFHKAAGVEIFVEPDDRAYDLRDYTVRDSSGYRLTFGHHLECPPVSD